MPAPSHKTDYAILIGLGLAVILVFALLLGWGYLRNETDEESGVRTTHSAGDAGTMAWYVLCERLNYKVERSEQPLRTDALRNVGVLVMINPVAPVARDERTALDAWVVAGGVLICEGGDGRLPWERKSPLFFGRQWAENWYREVTTTAGESCNLPLSRDVRSVAMTTRHVILGEGRVKDDDEDEPASGLTVHARGPMEPLFRDEAGLRIATRRYGEGRVIWLADSSFLSNRRIGQGDNPVLAINLVAYAQAQSPRAGLVFDEYHYGFGACQTAWGLMVSMLLTTSPGWAILALTAAGLLYLLYRGRRFGTRRGLPPAHRRSKLEYVHAVGATYRAAGAHALAFRLLWAWFRREAARRGGLPPAAPLGQVAAALARRTGKNRQDCEKLLNACAAAAAAPRMSARGLSRLAGQMAQIESEVSHGREAGQ